jgi:hypothetical protein
MLIQRTNGLKICISWVDLKTVRENQAGELFLIRQHLLRKWLRKDRPLLPQQSLQLNLPELPLKQLQSLEGLLLPLLQVPRHH